MYFKRRLSERQWLHLAILRFLFHYRSWMGTTFSSLCEKNSRVLSTVLGSVGFFVKLQLFQLGPISIVWCFCCSDFMQLVAVVIFKIHSLFFHCSYIFMYAFLLYNILIRRLECLLCENKINTVFTC